MVKQQQILAAASWGRGFLLLFHLLLVTREALHQKHLLQFLQGQPFQTSSIDFELMIVLILL